MNSKIEYEPEQIGIPCQIIRGGTSKAVFLLERHLPPPGSGRDALLRQVMGAPHFMRIDGIGGTDLLTSKIAIIGPATVEGADVDYTFAQVEVARDIIDYRLNCGNISAAVGGFAIDIGLVEARAPVTQVRIHNTNTGKILVGHVRTAGGKPRVRGDLVIAGVPGSGAEVFMDYRMTGGATTGKTLVTGNRRDRMKLESGRVIDFTLCDFANPAVFVKAEDVGLRGDAMPAEIDADKALLALLREIRGKAGVLCGFTTDWRRIDDDSAVLPVVDIVSAPSNFAALDGTPVEATDMDIKVHLIFMNHCHEAMAGTGSACIAMASRIPNSLAYAALRPGAADRPTVRIGNPSGVMEVVVASKPSNALPEGVEIERIGFTRTSRKLLEGVVFVPRVD